MLLHAREREGDARARAAYLQVDARARARERSLPLSRSLYVHERARIVNEITYSLVEHGNQSALPALQLSLALAPANARPRFQESVEGWVGVGISTQLSLSHSLSHSLSLTL